MANIFAYTANALYYPDYISVNVEEDGVNVIVRSPANEKGECGTTSQIKLNTEQVVKLAHTLFSFACTNKA
jgi:hypothetical protein